MIQYEELQMNALPSLQTILYDGWVLRFAKGYTNRANSVNPIYEGTKDGPCKTTHTFDENWFEQYCRLNHISERGVSQSWLWSQVNWVDAFARQTVWCKNSLFASDVE